MAEDVDVTEFGLMSGSGITREMADALMALRRTPLRPDVSIATPKVSLHCDVVRRGFSGAVRDGLEAESYTANNVMFASASVPRVHGNHLLEFPVTTVSHAAATASAEPSYLHTVSQRFWAESTTANQSLYTVSMSQPRGLTLSASRTTPISSAICSTSTLSGTSSYDDEVIILRERVKLLERLMQFRANNNQPTAVTGSGDAISGTPAFTPRPGEPPVTNCVDYSDSGDATKPYMPLAKLGVYRGETSLETFLAKFENCSQYLNWNDRDRFFQLSNALDGAAGQVLWDTTVCDSVESLVGLLRARFGSQNQAERFRVELKARRRRPGETLQKLYQDIVRLMALAYPGQCNEMSDSIARDSFIDALDDLKMRREILIQQPPNVDAALSLACRLEAYDMDPNDRPEAKRSTRSLVQYRK